MDELTAEVEAGKAVVAQADELRAAKDGLDTELALRQAALEASQNGRDALRAKLEEAEAGRTALEASSAVTRTELEEALRGKAALAAEAEAWVRAPIRSISPRVTPGVGQFDFVCPPSHTPHGAYVW